ncbi:single-stranded DNA-binding protein [Ectothiorhodospira shaposhnikovii]|uniref:single-stranded DNA-binding protein n=1 Tax=Ectothiorhodospira shaposhnikovii TaxID=1054 RepID=UPI001907AA62|nr:single-stranded DNA-binding protein [Ectothiorhodospira shaposhnikovii]MBK1674729.1 hypothetical protein [Ectothiorhodospira shaposhnikovii]
MSAEFKGSGNLGSAPNTRKVPVDGEIKTVTDIRVFFDRSVLQDDGTYEEDGGFWLTVTTWGKLAEHCARVLLKGMRVRVEGKLREHSWESEEGPRTELRLTATHVTLELGRVESVQLRARDHER